MGCETTINPIFSLQKRSRTKFGGAPRTFWVASWPKVVQLRFAHGSDGFSLRIENPRSHNPYCTIHGGERTYIYTYIFTCMHMIKFNHVIQINKHARFMDGSWVCDISKLKHHQGWHLNLLVLGIPFFAFYKKGPGSLVIKVVITPTNPI